MKYSISIQQRELSTRTTIPAGMRGGARQGCAGAVDGSQVITRAGTAGAGPGVDPGCPTEAASWGLGVFMRNGMWPAGNAGQAERGDGGAGVGRQTEKKAEVGGSSGARAARRVNGGQAVHTGGAVRIKGDRDLGSHRAGGLIGDKGERGSFITTKNAKNAKAIQDEPKGGTGRHARRGSLHGSLASSPLQTAMDAHFKTTRTRIERSEAEMVPGRRRAAQKPAADSTEVPDDGVTKAAGDSRWPHSLLTPSRPS